MELLWKEETVCALEGDMPFRVEAEGAVPLPEGKGCTALLSAHSALESSALSRTEAGGWKLEGTLLLTLLCEDGREAYAFYSRAAFSHAPEGFAEADEGRLCCTLSAPEVKLGGDGTLHFHCAIEGNILFLRHRHARMLRGIDGLPGQDLQLRTEEVSQDLRMGAQSLQLRLREEAALPEAKEILACAGDVQLREHAADTGGVSGTLSLSLLYRDKGGALAQSLEHIPFRADAGENPAAELRLGNPTLSALHVRSMGEEFGILAAEAELHVPRYRRERRSFSLSADAYAPSLPFACAFGELEALCEAGDLYFRTQTETAVQIPEGLPEAAVPVYSCIQPVVTAAAVEKAEGKLCVEGVAELRVVYKNAAGSFYSFSDEIPFTAETPAGAADIVQIRARGLSAVQGGGRKLQLQMLLCFSASLFEKKGLRFVNGVEECEAPQKPHSGLHILYAGAGERLFDAAKRANTTAEAIRALNPGLEGDVLEEGTQLIMLL